MKALNQVRVAINKIPYVHVCRYHVWRYLFRSGQWFGVFRNKDRDVKRLGRRWGLRVLGFEIGDRG